MKILMCVFSGTGNTMRIAKSLAAELESRGYWVEVRRICASMQKPDMSDFDMLIVGYPVHAFNAPTAVLEFLKGLDRVDGKRAYIIHSSGEPLGFNDAAGITPRRILTKKGYEFLGEFSYVMPYNIIFKHTDEMAARMWNSALARVKRDAEKIAVGTRNKRRVNVFKRAVSFVLRIEHPAMPVIGRRFKTDKDKCVGCGMCVSLCPMGNISLVEGRVKFGKKCVGCMACSFGCPRDAVRISVLNGWRVNGGYSFDGENADDEQVCKYCRKSYIKYFHESESNENEMQRKL